MKDLKVLILEGGFNEEHEVSLETAKQVKKALIKLKINYDVLLVNPATFKIDIDKFDKNNICFNALHGTFGEDGKIQSILENKSFKFTHSDKNSSLIGFDKDLTKKEIKNCNILSPPSITINYNEITSDTLINFYNKFGSFLIKPSSSGSSFGINLFKDRSKLNLFLKNLSINLKLYKNHKNILIEKFIDGRELTVAVIENNNISSPVEVTEIISNNEYFDYQSKYKLGFAKHFLPANIPKHIYDQCKLHAKIIHDKINCKSISRSDFIYDNNNLYFLEINTQPGLTPISLVPEQLKYQNINFEEMILNILDCTR